MLIGTGKLFVIRLLLSGITNLVNEGYTEGFDDFKNKQKYLYSENVFDKLYIEHWGKTQMLKKFSLDKINGT